MYPLIFLLQISYTLCKFSWNKLFVKRIFPFNHGFLEKITFTLEHILHLVFWYIDDTTEEKSSVQDNAPWQEAMCTRCVRENSGWMWEKKSSLLRITPLSVSFSQMGPEIESDFFSVFVHCSHCRKGSWFTLNSLFLCKKDLSWQFASILVFGF